MSHVNRLEQSELYYSIPRNFYRWFFFVSQLNHLKTYHSAEVYVNSINIVLFQIAEHLISTLSKYAVTFFYTTTKHRTLSHHYKTYNIHTYYTHYIQKAKHKMAFEIIIYLKPQLRCVFPAG